jgi:phosphoglycerate dehydrogenase-like enzyme
VAAAGLDTLTSEPISADNPLAKQDNLVITPHVAWLTAENVIRSVGIAVENCRRLLHSEPLLHQLVP